ncbi:unnamed protein product [Enterobius vermicularis]|uniref:UDP-glucuronosyltransferase n=1 Tax=Enterobius vermicularis TaxID=51028 RepID=A0A0N4V129_ENTVE|nr:unnamed protein product [Enterobius vermicularis]
MVLLRTTLILLQCCNIVLNYRILIYAPQIAHSHVLFMGKIADTLVEAGHSVVNFYFSSFILNLRKLAFNIQWASSEILNDNIHLQQLKDEKFDIGITELVSFCGIPLFNKIGIKAHITAFAVNLFEGITEPYGVINNPSFVPDSAQTSFVFVNIDEYFDFPRPVTEKIVYVGGIAVSKPKLLDDKFEKIMNSALPNVVLISFGTVAKSSDMGPETKEAFVAMFKEFSNITFIWKYEENDHYAADLPNVIKIPWVPQNDLLNHRNLRAFISHGGLNSLTESIYAGIPVLCVPLFGDQMRNARIAEKRGIGITLDKDHLNSKTLIEAMKSILYDDRYAKASHQLAQIIAKKPMSAKERVVKYTNFAAQFGRISNLDNAGRKLNFFQYYLLDVITFLVLLVWLFFYIVILTLKLLIRNICSRKITKIE